MNVSLPDKRIRIFSGHFGSGKTEVAVNYALFLRQQFTKVGIADLDVVNPYFRTRERQDLFAEKDIRFVGSSINAPAIDSPAVSAEVNTLLEDKSWQSVLDVGGDPEGARVLGRFSGMIEDDEYDMFMVLNANRPETRTSEQVIRLMKRLEEVSRLRISGLINNTHLLKETSTEDLERGIKLVSEVSGETGVRVVFHSAAEWIADKLPAHLEGIIFPMKLYMRDEWMS